MKIRGESGFGEWRELWCIDGDEPGTFLLAEAHGCWDKDKKECFRRSPEWRRLGQYGTESEANKAMAERAWWLRGKGWIHQRIGDFGDSRYTPGIVDPSRAS
jgi:hypothetical protein